MESSSEVDSKVVLPDVGTGDDTDSEAVPEDAWEWRRLYHADDGTLWDLFCCPEDILRTKQCAHKNAAVEERHIVCKDCLVL